MKTVPPVRGTTGDVAIVTGAGRGIGRAIALELAAMGMRVALVARSRAELDAVRARIGDAALAVPTDVSQAGAVREMYETIRSSLGVPSVLVNSAGVYRYGLVAEASEADFDIVVGTNLKGTFATCRAVLPDMIAGGRGDIVNIASIAGKVGTSRRALYCASKFGVVGFTHALAEEVREHGIRATVICPGSTNTGFSPKDVEGKARDRMLQPEDIAHTVRMILSQRATSFMSEVVMRPTRKP